MSCVPSNCAFKSVKPSLITNRNGFISRSVAVSFSLELRARPPRYFIYRLFSCATVGWSKNYEVRTPSVFVLTETTRKFLIALGKSLKTDGSGRSGYVTVQGKLEINYIHGRVIANKLTVGKQVKKLPILWYHSVHYYVHKHPTVYPVLSHINPGENFTPSFSKTHFTLVFYWNLRLGFRCRVFLLNFTITYSRPINFSSLPYIRLRYPPRG
jgi:hypothetical protein